MMGTLKPAIKALDPKTLHEIHADVAREYREKPLVIGIDGNEANVARRVGSNMAAFRILHELYNSAAVGVPHRYVVYLKDSPRDDMPKEIEKWKYRVIPMRRMWTQVRLPWELYFGQEKPDVFFSPGHYSPRWCPCPLAVLILDTAYLEFGEHFRKQDLIQLRQWTARSIKRADHILAISQSTKNDILKYYDKFDRQVSVVHMGIDHEHFFFPQVDREINRVKEKFKIRGDYILYVGTLQPRKNLVRLVEGFNLLVNPPSPPLAKGGNRSSVSLVIAGKKGWMYDEIFAKMKELGLENRVIFTDYVSDEDLPPLMAGARCLALVALYEGFGIPVVEAMAVGTPAVVSNVSSLPEILGNAGYHVNPEDVDDIAEKLGKMLDLSNEEYYKLVDKGILQAAHFSWELTGRKVLEALEHLGGLPV